MITDLSVEVDKMLRSFDALHEAEKPVELDQLTGIYNGVQEALLPDEMRMRLRVVILV